MSQQYPLVSVNRDGSQTSYVYRAANDTVPDVAARLSNQRKPQQMSETNPDHMFLVYSNEWYHLQRDADKPSDTLIEVDSKDFVRRNYNPSFLEGYVAASLIGHLFDSIGNYGKYRGYTGRNVYKPSDGSYRAPTQNDQKAAPPLTVPGKGFITKRGAARSRTAQGTLGDCLTASRRLPALEARDRSAVEADRPMEAEARDPLAAAGEPPRAAEGLGSALARAHQERVLGDRAAYPGEGADADIPRGKKRI